MPKLFECGLPGFNPGNPKSKAVETMRFRPREDHALITGKNGVGKTSAFIEPPLSLLSRDQRSKKNRPDIAQRMYDCKAAQPYVFYAELLITNKETANDSNAVFCGQYIKNGATAPENAEGFCFIYQHSSDNLKEIDDNKPVYEKLGIRIVVQDEHDPNKKRIATADQIKADIRQKGGYLFNAKGNSSNGNFTKVLSEITRHDFATDKFIKNVVSRDEALNGLEGMKSDELLDRSVLKALESEFMNDEKQKNCSSILSNYCRQTAGLDGIKKDIEELTKAGKHLDNTLLPAAEKADAAFDELARQRKQAGALLASLNKTCDLVGTEIKDLEEEKTALETKLKQADKEKDSLEHWRLLAELEKADKDEKEGLSSIDAAAMQMSKAEQELCLAEACKAKHEYLDAKAKLEAAESVLKQEEEGLVPARLADVSRTLAAMHEERLAEARKSAEEAEKACKAKEEEKAKAEAMREDAWKNRLKAEYKSNDAAKAAENVVADISDHLEGTGQATAGRDARPSSWQEIKEASAKARAEKEAALEEAKEEYLAAEETRNKLDELRRVKLVNAKLATGQAERELSDAREKLNGLKAWADETGLQGSSLEALYSAKACSEEVQRLETRIAENSSSINGRNAEKQKLESLLNADKHGLQVPGKAIKIIEAAGLDCYTADNFLRSFVADQQHNIRARYPWITAAIAVEDDAAVGIAAEAIGKADDQWFPGGIAIVSQGLLLKLADGGFDEGIEPTGLRFTARPEEEHLANPETWKARITQRIAAIDAEIDEIKAQTASAQNTLKEFQEALSRFYSGPWRCLNDYTQAVETAEKLLEIKKEEEQSVEQEIMQAEAKAKKHEADAALAEQHKETAGGLERKLNRAYAMKDTLSKADAEAVKAEADLEAKEKELAAAEQAETLAKKGHSKAYEKSQEATKKAQEAETELHSFDVSFKETGSLIEDASWNQLIKEHHDLYLIYLGKSKDLDEQRSKIAEYNREVKALDESLKAETARFKELGGDVEAVVPDDVKDAVFRRLDRERREAKEYKDTCESKHIALKRLRDIADRNCRTHVETCTYKWDDFPIAKDQIDGNPSITYNKLKNEIDEANGALRKAESAKATLSNAIISIAKHRLEAPAEDCGTVEADEAMSKAKQADDALSKADKDLKSAEDRLIRVRNAYNSETNRYSLTEQAKLIAGIPSINPGNAAVMVDRRSTAVQGKITSLKSQLASKDMELKTVLTNLTTAAGGSYKKLEDIEKSSQKQVRFELGSRIRTDDSRKESLRNMVKAECGKAIKEASTAHGLDNERLDKALRSRVLKIRPILEAWCGLDGESKGQRIALEVKDPARGARGYVPWDELPSKSGGEKRSARLLAVIALQAACALEKEGSSIMFLDTPFSGLSKKALIDPIFEVCEKTNTQLIVVQDAVSDEIADRFPFRARMEHGTFQGESSPVFTIDAEGKDTFLAFLHEHDVAAQEKLEL